MKTMQFFILTIATILFCGCKDEEEVYSSHAVQYSTFIYQDQTNGKQKFGITISHPMGKVQEIKLKIKFYDDLNATIYQESDFTWRYGNRETEGIFSAPSSKRLSPLIKTLIVKINNHWYYLN